MQYTNFDNLNTGDKVLYVENSRTSDKPTILTVTNTTKNSIECGELVFHKTNGRLATTTDNYYKSYIFTGDKDETEALIEKYDGEIKRDNLVRILKGEYWRKYSVEELEKIIEFIAALRNK